jgi:hypothetical protein
VLVGKIVVISVAVIHVPPTLQPIRDRRLRWIVLTHLPERNSGGAKNGILRHFRPTASGGIAILPDVTLIPQTRCAFPAPAVLNSNMPCLSFRYCFISFLFLIFLADSIGFDLFASSIGSREAFLQLIDGENAVAKIRFLSCYAGSSSGKRRPLCSVTD